MATLSDRESTQLLFETSKRMRFKNVIDKLRLSDVCRQVQVARFHRTSAPMEETILDQFFKKKKDLAVR